MNSSVKNRTQAPALEFSPAAIADLEAMLAIEKQCFPSPWPRQHFLSEFSQAHSITLLARNLDTPLKEIVGYIVFWLIMDELHILNLAVAPSYRRYGIARGLIKEAWRMARKQNCRTAWLEVRPSNTAALALYQSFGFTVVMTRKRYYSDTGEDALILCGAI